jgi:hypothetical protein
VAFSQLLDTCTAGTDTQAQKLIQISLDAYTNRWHHMHMPDKIGALVLGAVTLAVRALCLGSV